MTEPTVVKSVRIRESLWAFVEARAELRGMKPNGWVVRCIEDAQRRLMKEAGR